jgi:hypothetical protein
MERPSLEHRLSSSLVRVASVIPLALLGAYAAAFGSQALGRTVLAYDDHPGQLYRLYHVVERGWAPWTWNPGWWTGYPELQFYPPGFAYAGALAHVALAGTVSVEVIYHALVWLAYVLPGLTTLLLFSRVVGDAWRASPIAFLALTLSADLASGVEGGVHIGMVAARLGWGLLPLVPWSLSHWTERGGVIPVHTILLVAAIVLMHPAHAPAAAVFLVIAALPRAPDRGARLRQAALALGLAAACTAFWTLPLLARLSYTHALAWGSLSLRAGWLAVPLAVAAALALRAPATPLAWALSRWAPVMAGIVAIDALVLEPLALRWLPADRVADSAWLAVVLAAGLFVAGMLARLPEHGMARPLAALGVIAVIVALGTPGDALTLWPRAHQWPSYGPIERGLALRNLEKTLAASPAGRVLFVRSGIPLVHGTEWYRPHTHITALVPRTTGRAIVNGTFTHPSTVAAFVYRGHAGPGALTFLAEQLDGRTLFGVSLAELDRALAAAGDRLGISTIVALEDDVPVLAPVAARAGWGRTSVAPFEVYRRGGGVALPEPAGSDRWEFAARGAAGTWISARVASYPLWHVESRGQTRATRTGPVGDLEVRLEQNDERLTLRYAAGLPERAGFVVTLVALLGVAVAGIRRVRRGSAAPAARGEPPSALSARRS